MSGNLDRFDRMILGIGAAAYKSPEQRVPVITSKRGPRFVDHTNCPLCGAIVGVEYRGTLLNGSRVNAIAAHTSGKGSVVSKQPRCLGAAMRIEFLDGNWRGTRR